METAQIWKSIEALNSEAAAILKDSTPVIAVIKSVPPPACASEQRLKMSNISVLGSNPTPPKVNLSNKHKNDNTSIEAPLLNTTMVEIAAAIERASKMPKTTVIDQSTDRISDAFRQDLLTEVERAVRLVLAAELPHLVRYAVSVSMHELLTTSKKPEAHRVNPIDRTSPKMAARAKEAKNPLSKDTDQKSGAKR